MIGTRFLGVLALAATVGSSTAVTSLSPTLSPPSSAVSHTQLSESSSEFGGGPGAARVCLSCAPAALAGAALLGPWGVFALFAAGGPAAVAAGTAVASCVAACSAYFAE